MKLKHLILTALLSALIAAPAQAKTITDKDLSLKQKRTLAIASKFFKNHPSMIKVAFCESSLEHTENDGTVKRGDVDPRDTGLMQINKGYHQRDAARMGLNLNEIHDNMRYALYLYKRDGLQPWNASKPCWDNLHIVMRK